MNNESTAMSTSMAQGESVDWDAVPTNEFDSAEESSSESTEGEVVNEVENEEPSDSGEDSELDAEQVEESGEEVSDEDSEEDSELSEDEEDTDAGEEEAGPETSLEQIQKDLESGEYKFDMDGEEVNLTDLKNSWKGHKEVDRRFTELDKDKKQLQGEVGEIEGYISNFADKMQNGDAVGAFTYFGQFSGIPPYMIREQLMAALKPEFERREIMSAHELQNEYLAEQNNYLKEQNESAVKLKADQQANMDLESSVNNLRETHSISQENWNDAMSFLKEQEDIGELSPDRVSDYILDVRAYDKVDEVLTSLDVKPTEGDDKFINAFQQIIKNNPDFTDEDLKELVKGSMKQQQEESLGKQIKTRKEKSGIKESKKVKEDKQKISEPVLTESIEDDWDNL